MSIFRKSNVEERSKQTQTKNKRINSFKSKSNAGYEAKNNRKLNSKNIKIKIKLWNATLTSGPVNSYEKKVDKKE